jgi:hypothetical protein
MAWAGAAVTLTRNDDGSHGADGWLTSEIMPLGDDGQRHYRATSEVVEQSGLCCRTIQNLEERGLLERVNIGIDKALYSDKSVRACFKIEGAA